MTLFDIWVIEALAFMVGGMALIAVVCWFIDQFNKDN